jgi:tRNA threonylcarbamoyladenosine biosynthesis protein TsaE
VLGSPDVPGERDPSVASIRVITCTVTSLDGTHRVAAAIAGMSRIGDVIVLSGDMGAGKTAFAQGFGRALGVTEPITSPTFTVVHTYDTGRILLHHADLYRLDRTSEIDDLALAELTEDEGVLLVEWGDVAADRLGSHLLVSLEPIDDDDDARRVTISPVGSSWSTRWPKLEAVLSC